MDAQTLAILALGIIVYSLISGRIERTVLTAPIIFMLLGLAVGDLGLSLLRLELSSEFIAVLAELTLVLILFSDAARVDLTLLRKEHDLPIRLLAIGLPLTIALAAAAAALLLPGLGLWEAVVLGTIVAPTDAALGQAVVSSPEVPVRVRQALNIESGLNDGLALPVLLLALSMAGASAEPQSAASWLRFAAAQVTLGPLVGVLVGFIGGKLIVASADRGWISSTLEEIAPLALAFFAYAGAELVGGNGFIAAFFAGLTLGNTARALCVHVHEFAEAEGELLTLLVFLLLGAILLPDLIGGTEWWPPSLILFVVAALTVARLVPVALSLLGTSVRWETVVFIGWFGPRGIASVLYLLLVLEGMPLAGMQVIAGAVLFTVATSIFAHGLSAYPGAQRYAARLSRMRGEEPLVEHARVTEMPTRRFSRGVPPS